MASQIPKYVKKEKGDEFIAETWKVCLLTNAFTFVPATHMYYTDLTNELPTGGGYVAGGQTITGKVGAYVDTNNYSIDATDTMWTGATFTARHAIIYRTSDNKIRAYKDLKQDWIGTGGAFLIKWNSGGIVKIL